MNFLRCAPLSSDLVYSYEVGIVGGLESSVQRKCGGTGPAVAVSEGVHAGFTDGVVLGTASSSLKVGTSKSDKREFLLPEAFGVCRLPHSPSMSTLIEDDGMGDTATG